MTGSANSVSGSVSRTRPTAGRPSRPAGAQVTTNPGRTAPPEMKPKWRPDRIVWTNGDSELHYVFDDSVTTTDCRGSIERMTCYGPEPERPDRERDREAPPPPISPQEIVERTIVNVRLPRPEPNVDPGYAVTGLRAYLETGNGTEHTFAPIPTVLGPLSISATSTYRVSWGDGTTTGPHASNGGKYPNGDITHLYQRTGVVDITVTQNWTATWQLAGQSGTISGLTSSGTLENFVIREVQASRRR